MGRDEVCAAVCSLVLLGSEIEFESLGSDMGTVCVRGRVFSGCCVAPQASCAFPRPLPTLISLPPNSSLYRPVVSFRIRHPPAAAALGSLPCSGSMFPPHASHSFIIGFSFSFPASPAPTTRRVTCRNLHPPSPIAPHRLSLRQKTRPWRCPAGSHVDQPSTRWLQCGNHSVSPGG